MKARDVLNVWTGWDSPDIFKVDEISGDGHLASSREMTGVDLMNSPIADREIINFGSYGKGSDGKWRHYVTVTADDDHSKSHSQIHIEFLRQRYGKKAEAWKGCPDDREVFSNIYFNLIEAYEAVDGIEAPYVVISLNRTCREKRETLDRIAKVFEGREGGEPIA